MRENIESVLIQRLLRKKRWLDYLPLKRGLRYRALRMVVTGHPVIFGLLAALLLGAIARWGMEPFVPGFWESLSAGELGHIVNFAAGIIVVARAIKWIDEQLYFDPHRFARKHFQRLAFPWQDAYRAVEIENREALDRHVITARHAGAVEDELTYGILVAKVADVLAETSCGGTLKGLESQAVIEMMMAQKLDDDAHQTLMEELFKNGHSSAS